MKFLILLSGCGLGDGSAIEEVILIYTILDKYGINYIPVAQNKYFTSVNHFTKKSNETRNVLFESARMGRGLIQDIEQINYDDYDALIIPGGNGLIHNYQDSKVVSDLIENFQHSKKLIGTMCAGIDFICKLKDINILNEEIKTLRINEFYYEPNFRIYYTPAFRKGSNIFEIQVGIDKMISSIIVNIKR